MLEIRASSLPAYLDCARKSAGVLFREDIVKAGYELAYSTTSIAAKMGNHLHTVAASMLRAIQNSSGYLTRAEVEEAVLVGVNALRLDLFESKGWVSDATTHDEDEAAEQLRKMAYSIYPVLQTLQPTHIEHPLEATISPLGAEAAFKVKVTGTLDVRDIQTGRFTIYDHKSGADVPSAHGQLGLYVILCRLNGLAVDDTQLIYTRRTRKDQPPAEVIRFDIEECVETAWQTVRQIQLDWERWHEVGKPHVFHANTMSRLCTRTYCTSYDTSWCKKGAEVHG